MLPLGALGAFTKGLVEVVVGAGVGTIIGDFTTGAPDAAGQAAAFDGDTDQSFSNSARTVNASTGYIGKDWGSGNDKLISRAFYNGPNNSGICETDTSVRLRLQGSATGAWSGEEVTLADSGTVDKSANNSTVDLVYSGGASYRYHRVYCTGGNGSEKFCCSELTFTEKI